MTAPHEPELLLGCDLVALSEVRSALDRFGERYLRRVFTEREVADCTGPDRVARLAARYAAKEATVKALAVTDGATPPRDVEVVLDGPVPRLRLHGELAERAGELGCRELAVTLSHTDCHAAAVVAGHRAPDRETSS
jgi:holo-[acyl-carrier protein] synthase